MTNSKVSRTSTKKPSRDTMSLDVLFSDLRQGARNVAGVTWQVEVSVHLLVLARAGQVPYASMTPEGFEDLDCTAVDGSQAFVQMKETAAGEGRLTAVDVAAALKHAEEGARGAQIVLITDGELGSELGFTGWHGFLSGQSAEAVQSVVAALEARKLSGSAARDVVARSRLVQLPWRLRELTEQRLVDALGIHPTVASFAIDLMYKALAATAAEQRGTTLAEARTHTIADVDAAVAQVQSAVDVEGLDAAVAAGVCSTANFLIKSELQQSQFYAGVDGSPAHIAARLDVPRPGAVAEIRSATQQERYALLIGPSGSGKSVLLWRSARDAVPGARVLRIRRLRTSSDVDALVRHVQLLRPSLTTPVVVVADNLGRPAMNEWPEAAAALREEDGVVLIGACRAEDFRPALVSGPTRIVELVLDGDIARAVADRVEAAGMALAMTANEANARSGGLFMEYLALLTTGTRLEQVLARQAEELRQPGRELQREAAKLLTAAHSVGLGIDAERLGQALGQQNPAAVGDALSVLREEHVVVVDGATWIGLHELRSRTLVRLLHESPPPILATTFARTLALLDPAEAGWMLRRVAERDSADLPATALAAAEVLARDGITAKEAATLLEGAERADNAVYAKMCKPILDRHLRSGLTVHQLGMFVYGVRNQRSALEKTGIPAIDQTFGAIEQIAGLLQARPAATATVLAAVLTPGQLAELTSGADLEDAVRLLEAGAGLLSVTAELATSLLDAHSVAGLLQEAELWPRLVKALYDALAEDQRLGALGSVDTRALRVAHDHPLAVGLSIGSSGDEATLTVLLPTRVAAEEGLVWDSAPARSPEDLANDTAVTASRRLAAACPELRTVEVITVTPSGRRFIAANFEPGYKRMVVADALPDRVGVRRNVGFQSALSRLTAAQSWTEALREQIAAGQALAELVAEAPARLSARDNQGRRSAWIVRVQDTVAALAALATRPAVTGVDPAGSHANADEERRRADEASVALAAVANALPRMVESATRPVALAMTLRDAADKLATATETAAPTLTGLGSPIPYGLITGCRHLAGALAAIDLDPSGASRIRAKDLVGSVDRVIKEAAHREETRQRAVLEDHLRAAPAASLHRIQDPSPTSWAIDSTAWVVATPVEQWYDLCEVLGRIPDDTRANLGGRVVATACRGPMALFSARLASYGEQPLLPLPPEVARAFAEAAGLVQADGPATKTTAEFLDELVDLSWQTARDRARPADWPAIPRNPNLVFDDLERKAKATGAWRAEPDARDLQAALAVVLDQVKSELDGSQVITLAGIVFDAYGTSAQLDEAADLYRALAVLRLGGLTSPDRT